MRLVLPSTVTLKDGAEPAVGVLPSRFAPAVVLVGGGPSGGRAHGGGGRDQALQRVVLVGHLFPFMVRERLWPLSAVAENSYWTVVPGAWMAVSSLRSL